MEAPQGGSRDSTTKRRRTIRLFSLAPQLPEVFQVPTEGEEPENKSTGWDGGFDVVLNPPWERTAFEEIPYFADKCPDIANAPTTAERQRMIRELSDSNPLLFVAYEAERRKAVAENAFYSSTGLFSLSAKGRTNTFSLLC